LDVQKRNNKVIEYFPNETEVTTEVENNNVPHSAIKQHELTSNRILNWTNFNILAKEILIT